MILKAIKIEMAGGRTDGVYVSEYELQDGMTLRDYFAAKVMPAVYADYCAAARTLGFDEDWKMGIALDAYQMADAMLAERNKE